MAQASELPHDPYTRIESNFPFITEDTPPGEPIELLFQDPWYKLATHVENGAETVEAIAELIPAIGLDGFLDVLPSPETIAEVAVDVYSLVVLTRIALEAILWAVRNDIEVKKFSLHRFWYAPHPPSSGEILGDKVLYIVED
ncbi:hypothetical protein U3A55_11965 [Salarchaeum sp. III]|uniref:hypothetical protein n=1 Tax=Salarchaeum sp. III TaxID=3107927 RepID=UPI002EDA91A6